jgi:polyisoprenoid-binding protein YceI
VRRASKRTLIAAALAVAPVAVARAQAPAAAAPAARAAETWTIDRVHSDASFQIRHLVSKVRGRFNDFEGTLRIDRARPESSSVELRIKTASINTDNQRRDDHLRSPDFFDAANNPEITFKSTKVVARGQDKYDVTGTFTMRGVAKEITIPVTFLGFGNDGRGTEKAGFEATTVLNRKDFGILWNKALDAGGAVLGDEVQVLFNIEANKEAPPAAH